MREQQFIKHNTPIWHKLQNAVKQPLKYATEIPDLQRQCARHLAIARTRHYSLALQNQLEKLVFDGHQFLHSNRRSNGYKEWLHYLFVAGPQAIRREWRIMLLAHLLFYLPLISVFAYVWLVPSKATFFVDASTLSQIEFMYEPSTSFHNEPRRTTSDIMMWALYIQNNISIGLRSFALGLIAGLGSMFVLIFNGYFFGAIAAHLLHSGCGRPFFGFVVAHGAPELTGIVLSAGAGIRVGLAWIFPGRYKRLDALMLYTKRSLPAFAAAILLIFIAAFVEAFWSSLPLSMVPFSTKMLVGSFCWLMVYGWILLVGRRL